MTPIGRGRRLRFLLLAAAILGPAEAMGQDGSGTADPRPLFTRQDALWAGGFVVGTLALAPLDVYLAREIQDSIPQSSPLLRGGAGGFRILGFPGSLGLTGGLYLAGRILESGPVADAGLHATQAILLAVGTTGLTKGLVGRARPFLDPSRPWDLQPGRGFTHDRYQSFPSGHTTAAFATAAALTAEIGHHAPERKIGSGVLLYGAATLVGLSRMYHNAHWATDVLAGAAIGTFAGWKVVQYNHDRPGNPVDDALLARAPVLLVWTIPAR